MRMLRGQVDKAEKPYWEGRWKNVALSRPANPRDARLNNYPVRETHRFLCSTVGKISPPPKRLLEIGCANSGWLPYFALEHKLDVWGIDYTEVGCARSREIMRRAQLPSEQIICADLFKPPS